MPSHNPELEHRQAEPRPPEAVCLIVTIVGALRTQSLPQEQFDAFMAAITRAMHDHFPDFLPAHPPVTITWHDVRDDWIRRGPTDG
jgi:hypothetical protein